MRCLQHSIWSSVASAAKGAARTDRTPFSAASRAASQTRVPRFTLGLPLSHQLTREPPTAFSVWITHGACLLICYLPCGRGGAEGQRGEPWPPARVTTLVPTAVLTPGRAPPPANAAAPCAVTRVPSAARELPPPSAHRLFITVTPHTALRNRNRNRKVKADGKPTPPLCVYKRADAEGRPLHSSCLIRHCLSAVFESM